MFRKTNFDANKVYNFQYDEVLYNEIPEDIKYSAQSKKDFKGYNIYQSGEYDYLAVYAGRKNTGGYSIEVIGAEEKDNQIDVYVREERPGMKYYVTQALTYPYTIVRFKHTNKKVVVKDEMGHEYENIETFGELY